MNKDTEKECYTCGVVKPHADYYASQISKDGLLSNCRLCVKEYERKRREAVYASREKPKETGISQKCVSCCELKDQIYFYGTKKDGVLIRYSKSCKICRSAQNSLRYYEHRNKDKVRVEQPKSSKFVKTNIKYTYWNTRINLDNGEVLAINRSVDDKDRIKLIKNGFGFILK